MMLKLHGYAIVRSELTRGVKVLNPNGVCVCYIATSGQETDQELVLLVEAMYFNRQPLPA